MCQFESPTIERSLSHLRLLHGSDPRFSVLCGIGGCSYTGESFSALYSHIYRNHGESGIIKKRTNTDPCITAQLGSSTSVPADSGLPELSGEIATMDASPHTLILASWSLAYL